MKTSALSAMQRSFKDPRAEAVSRYNYDQQFSVLVDGKEQPSSLFSMLYTTLLYLRLQRPLRVYIAQGGVIFEHDGTRVTQADGVFITVLSEFEAFMLAERRDGYEEGRLSVRKELEEAELGKSPAQIGSAETAPVQGESTVESARDAVEDSSRPREHREEGGRRENRRRR